MTDSAPAFIHLHVHSAYSLSEGALPVRQLAQLAIEYDMPALAITDTGNLFGALEFSEELAENGVQPIIGCTMRVGFADATSDPRQTMRPKIPQLVLLAKDVQGYANLMKLSSRSYLESPTEIEPHVSLDVLSSFSEGLICLTGGPDGPINQALVHGQGPLAKQRCGLLKDIFGDRLYIELQRHNTEAEQRTEPGLIELAYDGDIPLVATNEAYFATADDFAAHDALICIAQGEVVGNDNRHRLTPEHCFKRGRDMVRLFADLPEATANTIEIARRCAFRPLPAEPILPRFAAERDEPEELRVQARDGLAVRLSTNGPVNGYSPEDYEKRLEFELDVIINMNFPGYFLIVADFIKFAKAKGIPVGPGRGSGAGSLVAYALTITDLDPLRFNLLFERFLNPERVSMPDFDIDFCQDRRDEVIAYVQNKFGADRVAQIITFGKLQARAVCRDVGRVLQMPYGQVDRLCKLIPNNPASPVTLKEAVNGEPRLQEEREKDPLVRTMLEIGMKLEGLYRHASTHAAGVVIGDRPLEELVPLYRDPRSNLAATQFSMKWVEKAGLVKFDFLGLKTLTVIAKAQALIRERNPEFDIQRVPFDDKTTYEMLGKGDTVGVFQLESSGMRDVLRKMHADCIEDIIAIVALYRPGPMDNIPRFIACKRGEELPDSLHPLVEPILKETYGIMVYQEQVMQIAQVLSGYSLGEADLLRRAMGKKIKSEMDQQKQRFVSGAVAQGVPAHQADYIFELVAKFAGYGFNKSHAAAYGVVAYQTAYLKANHPTEFLAASMTLDLGNTDKLQMFRREAQKFGVKIRAPSINSSGVEFRVGEREIRYSLSALKNVGRGAIEHLESIREAGGPFVSIGDFARRIDGHVLNKRALESLAKAGAFDCITPHRRQILRLRRDDPIARAPQFRPSRSRPERLVRGGIERRCRGFPTPKKRAVAADGAPERRVRGGGVLSFRTPARRLCEAPGAAGGRIVDDIPGKSPDAGRDGGEARRHGDLQAGAAVEERQPFRVCRILGPFRPVRDHHLFGHAGGHSRSSRTRNGAYRAGRGGRRFGRGAPTAAERGNPRQGRGQRSDRHHDLRQRRQAGRVDRAAAQERRPGPGPHHCPAPRGPRGRHRARQQVHGDAAGQGRHQGHSGSGRRPGLLGPAGTCVPQARPL